MDKAYALNVVYIFLLIIAIVLASWFYFRMKKLQNQIQMEMSDISNLKTQGTQNVHKYEGISSSK